MESLKNIPPAPWSLPLDEIYDELKTGREGITEDEARVRRGRFGDNTLPKSRGLNALTIFLHQFGSPLIFVLIGASVLTVLLNEWLDTSVILFAILLNVALGFYQEYRADRALEKLTSYVRERARVVRRGIEQEIDSSVIAPGDVITVSAGSRVPADARIVVENGLGIDESILTGESLAVRKKTDVVSKGAIVADRANMLHAGTLVVEGHGVAVATGVGANTEIGKIARLVAETDKEQTPLQKSVWRLAWIIFALVVVLVGGLLYLGLSRGEGLLEMLLVASAVAVGAIPESLPIALTVILAIGVERIAGRRGIIRNLAAAETLGSATLIMTDKTGTLTQANMRLVGILSKAELASGQAFSFSSKLENLTEEKRKLMELSLLGTDSVLTNPSEAKEKWIFSGRPIESNIAKAANEHDFDVIGFAKERRFSLLDFNSTNKFSIARDKKDGTTVVIGAPDVLLSRSKLTKDDYVAIEKQIHDISTGGKRILGIARLPKTRLKDALSASPIDAENLDFSGMLIFSDPLRDEAPEALKRIEALGAKVIMLTGDLKGTALAVGKELGWDVNEGNVVSGEELRRMSDAELSASLSKIRIFARVTPEDKLRIGKLYQQQGEVVAMTGDGVNDAPSLKAMDIGIALGSGSDVAKSIADLVLLDDNFKIIVAAIEEGRRILGNIRKAFVYLLSNALDEVFLIGGALLAGLPLPLNALQIIWVNLFTGSLPALSYAFDENFDVSRAGKKSVGEIFNTEVKVLTIGIGIATSALLFVLYWALLAYGIELDAAKSILFICFASYILVAAFSLRSLHRPIFSYPLFTNRYLNWSVLSAAALLIVTVTVPWFQHAFGIAPPPLSLLWIVAVWLVINIVLIEGAKWFFRAYGRHKVKTA